MGTYLWKLVYVISLYHCPMYNVVQSWAFKLFIIVLFRQEEIYMFKSLNLWNDEEKEIAI